MSKPKPQELAQQNRQAFVQGKFMEINKILFQGLNVGEIGQILQALNQNLNSLPVGKPEEEVKEVKEK